MKKLKVITIVGTRPELIRLSRIIPLFDKFFNHLLIHTGQNYDFQLNQVFFDDLGIRRPDLFFNIDNSSVGSAVSDLIKKTEVVFISEKPDALLILGDTNSSLSAYIAKRLHVPIFHMEAGNRSFDLNVPEEINRKIIDHIADYNLVYTEHARRHLIAEGLQHRRIYLSGSPMKEVLNHYQDSIFNSTILNTLNLVPQKYFVVSAHREENVDSVEKLYNIIGILNRLSEQYNVPVIISTHPRTRKRLGALHDYPINNRLLWLEPFGFFDYIKLQINALCTLSDSGTISEESAILNFPAISIRQSMERPEAQDCGTIILSGLDPDIVLDSVALTIDEFYSCTRIKSIPIEYEIMDTSWRVMKLIMGNCKLSNKWDAIGM